MDCAEYGGGLILAEPVQSNDWKMACPGMRGAASDTAGQLERQGFGAWMKRRWRNCSSSFSGMGRTHPNRGSGVRR
jgi:hypothetical protein